MGLSEVAPEVSFTVWNPEDLTEGRVPRWAVLGRSNVGKSSFLNALTHPKSLFRTGRRPGVTVGLIGVHMQLTKSSRSQFEVVDLPGYGFSEHSVADHMRWQQLALRLREGSHACGLQWIWLVDPARVPEAEESQMLSWLGREPFTLLFTKSDQCTSVNRRKEVESKWQSIIEHSTEGPYWVSSKSSEGLPAIFKSARSFVKNWSEVSQHGA